MRRPLIAAAGILILSASALAQDATPGVGRYEITPSEDGFTRLDTETGAVSHCGKRDGVWHCEPLPGADADLERKLDGLAGEVARLSDNLDALAARLDALTGRLDALAAQRQSPGLTAAEEARRADEALGLAERVMRRFFDMVREMKRAEGDQI